MGGGGPVPEVETSGRKAFRRRRAPHAPIRIKLSVTNTRVLQFAPLYRLRESRVPFGRRVRVKGHEVASENIKFPFQIP